MRYPPLFTRCWCGRPQRESTGTCNQGHDWSEATEQRGRAEIPVCDGKHGD